MNQINTHTSVDTYSFSMDFFFTVKLPAVASDCVKMEKLPITTGLGSLFCVIIAYWGNILGNHVWQKIQCVFLFSRECQRFLFT